MILWIQNLDRAVSWFFCSICHWWRSLTQVVKLPQGWTETSKKASLITRMSGISVLLHMTFLSLFSPLPSPLFPFISLLSPLPISSPLSPLSLHVIFPHSVVLPKFLYCMVAEFPGKRKLPVLLKARPRTGTVSLRLQC